MEDTLTDNVIVYPSSNKEQSNKNIDSFFFSYVMSIMISEFNLREEKETNGNILLKYFL